MEVYTEYPTTKGIIHDSNDLSVIYEVIDLWDPDKFGARKVNKKRISVVKARYRKILRELSQGTPRHAEAERVAALFGSSEGRRATFVKAMHHIRCQIGQKDRFQEGLIRSGAYIEEMKGIFRAHGLPEDLAYLPHVESSFNLKAHSKAGAAGIWQFTRATGKRFLTIGQTVDERRDPIQSTEAAAQLLKENFERMGNWPLAITAYNYGMKGLGRSNRSKDRYEEIFTDYKSRRFRFASRNFYSEFLAAREAAKNHEQYFGPIELSEPPETLEVLLETRVTAAELFSHFNVDAETLRNFNPALGQGVFKHQRPIPKGYILRLPAGALQDLRPSSVEARQDAHEPRKEPGRYYHVQKGDTLSEIAEAQGLKVDDLIAANDLDSRSPIYVNQKLLLPLPFSVPSEPDSMGETSLQAGGMDQDR